LKPVLAAEWITSSPIQFDAKQTVYSANAVFRHAHSRMQPLIGFRERMLTENLSTLEWHELMRLFWR